MTKKSKLYIVYLRPEAVEFLKLNNYVSIDVLHAMYSISCSMVDESSYFLRVTTLSDREVELQIPYQYVLYIMATPDSKLKKTPGFHRTEKAAENPPDGQGHS